MTRFGSQRSHLHSLYQHASEIPEEVRALVADLEPESLCWSPSAGTWSIAHCLDHLAKATDSYQPRIEAAIRRARGSGRSSGEVLYRPGWLARKFIVFVGPDAPRKLKAPSLFRPTSDPGPEAVERFLAAHAKLCELMETLDPEGSSDLDLNRARLASPVTRLLRFSVNEALAVVILHDLRHLRQARRIRENPAFPG